MANESEIETLKNEIKSLVEPLWKTVANNNGYTFSDVVSAKVSDNGNVSVVSPDKMIIGGKTYYRGPNESIWKQITNIVIQDSIISLKIAELKATSTKLTDENGNLVDETQQQSLPTDKLGDANVNIDTDQKTDDQKLEEQVISTLKRMYEAWDPRLQRADYFLMSDDNDIAGIRVPFSSYTAATAFGDQAWKMESGMAIRLANEADSVLKNSGIYKLIHSGDAEKYNSAYNEWYAKNKANVGSSFYPDTAALSQIDKAAQTGATQTTASGDPADKVTGIFDMPIHEKVMMQNTDLFYKDDKFWGVQSIINPYSLTRLTGGLGDEGHINYMYDIRDRRRFYGLSVGSDDVLAVSNPTVTLLIEWGNSDYWGRTPYSFLDFVYCKYFGLIPNNRLITFRRYSAPCLDNLQFENMYGSHESITKDANGKKTITAEKEFSEENVERKTFSPHASVVTWFGGDTGNTLSGLLNFSTGMKWGNVESKIHEVSGNEGESKQSVIDKLLGDGGEHTGLFGSAEHEVVNSFLQSKSWLTAKVASFGKFNLAMNGEIGMDQAAFDSLSGANTDPYDQTLANRILGPVNRIDSVRKRDAGIDFSQSLTIKCQYMAKSIGGINPKAALLDCLGNCLEMASPHAVFWGGGYRFMIKPLIYPFHDGGWRDSFMAKIYDGKFLGSDGAVGTILSGIKSVGTDADGNFSMDSIKSSLGSAAGGLLSMVGSAILSVADMFGGSDLLGSLADGLNGKGAQLQGKDPAQAKADAQAKINNYFTNQELLWHNKMAAATIQPQISGMGSLLIGAPVGEWHLTIGNPFNPIAVIGNLICSKMEVAWEDELGPDDFPIGFTVTYTIEHGMARDSDAIQSMFNRGMGKFYTLPDWMSTSSDGMTHVDKYTADNGHGDTGTLKYKNSGYLINEAHAASAGGGTFLTKRISGGTRPLNAGNYNTQLVTKFTPLNNLPSQTLTINQIRNGDSGNLAVIRSLGATRKLTGE